MSLTHVDEAGAARMVDVSAKDVTTRSATAQAIVRMSPETLSLIRENALKKGDAISVARIAGIMAAKRVDELIPLCHTLALSAVLVDFEFGEGSIKIVATATTSAQTGVEMEALTAASVAALTIYDMAKASDRSMEIGSIRLLKKTGGKSGDYLWKEPQQLTE